MKHLFLFNVLFFIFLSANVFAATNRFDGNWYGNNPCNETNSFAEDQSRDIIIEIKDGKTQVSIGRWPVIEYKGKVFKKIGSNDYKLGLNSNRGRIEGNFISIDKLVLNKGKSYKNIRGDKINCEFILTKNRFKDDGIINTKKIAKTITNKSSSSINLNSNNNLWKKYSSKKNKIFTCETAKGTRYETKSPCSGLNTKTIRIDNDDKENNKTVNKIIAKTTTNKSLTPVSSNSNNNLWKKYSSKKNKIFTCETAKGTRYKTKLPCSGLNTKTIRVDNDYEKNNELEKKQIVNNNLKTQPPKTKIVEQTIEIENDSEGPKILVANKFEANNDLTASIKGQITDQSAIVSFVIDGDEVSIVNGSFNKELYVFPGGQEVEIIARDKHGNKSETTVQLVRATVVVEEDKFDFLDPRKIRAKTNKNAVAIIIGIEDYESTFAAPFATNDAVTFNDFARLSLGIPANNIKLLTNDEAERNDTLKVLRTWLPKKIIDSQTELYVFYSGHGLASDDGSDLYLLPADGDPDLLEDTTILRNQMFDIIAELNPKRVTMFFDTCYSGATRDEELLVAAKPIFIEATEQDIPNNFNIFSASSGKETAKVLKEAEHGLFSYYMMKGLEGEADSNNDQTITNGELFAFINKNVSRQANQTPQLNGDPDQILVQW